MRKEYSVCNLTRAELRDLMTILKEDFIMGDKIIGRGILKKLFVKSEKH